MALKSQIKTVKILFNAKLTLHKSKCLLGQIESGNKFVPNHVRNLLVFTVSLMESALTVHDGQ